MQQIYRRTTMSKWDFNKVALQLYWNHTLAWVFSCKFAAYFQTTFPKNTPVRLLLWFLLYIKVHKLSSIRLVRMFCIFSYIKKQPLEVFYKKGVLNNFANFTGKHLCWSLFLIKLHASGLKPITLFKKASNTCVFR